MIDVKPWDPVAYSWNDYGTMFWDRNMSWIVSNRKRFSAHAGIDLLSVYLANGQRIIVRALSDERKAARAAMKEAVS